MNITRPRLFENSKVLINNTMGMSIDSKSEGLEKDTVSLNRTSPVRAQYKKGEKNLLLLTQRVSREFNLLEVMNE